MEYTELKLYIQIRDGEPFQNPIPHDNFIQAFPDIDPNNLPADQFAKFVRVSPPKPGPYEILTSTTPTYEWVGDTVKDVYSIRPMTDEEKAAKQKKVKDEWAARPQVENWSAWAFNEETCQYEPPIPRPAVDMDKAAQGIKAVWCGAENNWKDTPPIPGNPVEYKFDFFKWEWVAR